MKWSLILAAIQRNFIRAIAALFLLGLTICLAVFNVAAWLGAGLIILAILAAFFEGIGFVFAVLVEDAIRQRRFDRALICLGILIGSAAFNCVGGHRAWDDAMAPRQEADQHAAQEALDARRAELQLAISRADAEIARVPMPAADAMTGRQQEARETWQLMTAAPSARREAAEASLSALPVVAEAAPPFAPEIVWGFLAFLEFAKALGLYAIGMVAAPKRAGIKMTSFDAAAAADFDISEAARRLVAMRRDRQGAEQAA